MKTPNWTYQPKMIADVLSAVSESITHKPSPDKGCVLAGSMSSGKTRMALLVVDQLLKGGTVENVLISAHGQTVLRSQMAEEAAKLKAEGLISFTFDTLLKAKAFQETLPQVVIALPQTVALIKDVPRFDLVVVDEAHEFYFAKDGMLQRIIKDCKARFSLFLTGTPSKFIADGRFPIAAAASAFDLLEHNVVTSPAIRLAQSSYDFTQADYNKNDNLTEDAHETPAQTKATMDDVLAVIHRELASRLRTSPQANQFLNVFSLQKLKDILPSFGKTMFACHSIRQARQIRDYFEDKGISVTMSTSEDGQDDGKLEDFTNDPTKLVLLVVRRGILGFNCATLVNLVDLTCTQNVDRLSQLFGRILRLHPDDKTKLFLKVVPHGLVEYNYHLMSFVLSLCDRERFMAYAGQETATYRVREFKQKGDKDGKESDGTGKSGDREPKVSIPTWEWDLNLLEKVYTRSDELFSDYAQSTLREVKLRLGRLTCRTVQEWVKIAEELAANNEGRLPNSFWLSTNYRALEGTVRRYPHLFAHLNQEKRKLGTEETLIKHVETANRIANENGGLVPNTYWLRSHGYKGIERSLLKYPERFSHLKWERIGYAESLNNHVKTAERLVENNDGAVPTTSWMAEHGHYGLYAAMEKYPERFSHLGRSKLKFLSISEHVASAERLSQANGGGLPCKEQLIKHGHRALVACMRRHPEDFSHIPQIWGKTVKLCEVKA
jgi:superfamily II DNA or RNA helicase